MTAWWPWDVLIILGAYHGLNPGMGWLFAVARGLQERRRSAVWESFLPIAIGHEAAIGVVVVLVVVAQFLIAPAAFSPWKGIAAATLHTLALLIVMGLVAIVVYERVGVAFLHRAWFNVDLLWTVTLLAAGVITLFS